MRRPISQLSPGFTLLEVLIATLLVGTVFVAVVGLLSQSLRNVDRMKPHERALLHAQEKMSEVLLREELEPGMVSGEWEDGYRWQVRITSSQPNPALQNASFDLFQVHVQISWDQRETPKAYSVQTVQWARRVSQSAAR
jgi:type II secretion system protein I